MNNLKRLSHLRIGEEGRISKLEGSDWEVKLLEMGCIPGAKIKVEHIAPLGDPIAVSVADYSLSLRKSEAETILVEEN